MELRRAEHHANEILGHSSIAGQMAGRVSWRDAAKAFKQPGNIITEVPLPMLREATASTSGAGSSALPI